MFMAQSGGTGVYGVLLFPYQLLFNRACSEPDKNLV